MPPSNPELTEPSQVKAALEAQLENYAVKWSSSVKNELLLVYSV